MSNPFPLMMTAPADVYRQRRAALAADLTRPLVLFAGHAPARNYPTNTYPFQPASTYRYFGGPPVESAALLIEPHSDGAAGAALFRPRLGPDDTLWTGPPPGDAELAAAAGLTESRIADLAALGSHLASRAVAGLAPARIETQRQMAALGVVPADPPELLAVINLRLRKDTHEVAAMRRAADVTVAAHRAALAAARPGRREADVAAAFHAVLVAHECHPSFTPIVTVRGEVLHGQGYPNVLHDGELLLIDAGAEEPTGYASDVTRTVPVGGRWTAIQQHLYETVQRALHEAIAACVPGRRYRDVHDLAARVICAGLVQAELLRGDADDLARRHAHTLFFPHGVGHLIGLDAHDMEDFGDLAGYAPGRQRRPAFGSKFLRLDRDLEPGYAVTIEPGIYLVPGIWQCADLVGPLADVVNRPNVDALLKDRFGGIRIEHTICVRAAGGPEVLTADLPTDPAEIAACVGRG